MQFVQAMAIFAFTYFIFKNRSQVLSELFVKTIVFLATLLWCGYSERTSL